MLRPLAALASGLLLAACERGFLPLGGRFEVGHDAMVVFVGGDGAAGGDLYALQADGGGRVGEVIVQVRDAALAQLARQKYAFREMRDPQE